MFELNNFDSLCISIAGPEKIREWSRGEVTKPETINYRTQKPETGGLFCEKIFGPQKDWECHCGRYKRIKYKGVICDKCGVEVTRSKVRRERMGHIELAAPVSHIWYFRGVPSRIGLLLDISPKHLEQVIYFVNHIVLESKLDEYPVKTVISDRELIELRQKHGTDVLKVGMGAEAVKTLLLRVNLEEELKKVRALVDKSTGQKKVRAVKRLEIVDAFVRSSNKPEWMVLDVLPVIPPEIRPMVQLDGGRFATSDLNDLYRRVINRNNRLKRLIEMGSPDIIVRNEKRMLQEAVDALIDNGRRGKAVSGAGNRELKSLSNMLRGKQGRFRQNLLGKRVDYSGRSVIVVGPELKLYQCGLPKEMALELFKPFVMNKLVQMNSNYNIKTAKRMVERVNSKVWDILEEVIADHPVLLNRAPTLHRLGIQAFEPVLVEGRALKLHPLSCTAFNADFDGDQMAVHVPLSLEAQTEARFLMLSTNNILKLSDGRPVVSPTQDMVIGSYYLTITKKGAKGEGRVFKDFDEAVMAYEHGEIELQSRVKVRVFKEIEGVKRSHRITTTLGRLIFNEGIPQDVDFGFKPDTTGLFAEEYAANAGFKLSPEDVLFQPRVNTLVGKKELSQIVDCVFRSKGSTGTAVVLDKIKSLGFKYSTIGAITTSIFDMVIPKAKKQDVLQQAEKDVVEIEQLYKAGYMTQDEKYKNTVKVWSEATDVVTKALMDGLDELNPIFMMANSGARGNKNQIRQLAGMRGLMTDPNGKVIETPVRACFREGLTVLEYFISSHGGRKGLADTALKTADSGYLTRRLVDVSQDVIVREDDCFETNGDSIRGIEVEDIKGDLGQIIEKLEDRLIGRFAAADIIHYKTKEVLCPANEMITEELAKTIAGVAKEAEEAGKRKDMPIKIRSVLTCRSKVGVCAKCYGKNMAGREKVKIGEAVGIIAAQSIGEPGTQLTMRTFHTGGVASADDITQGLPRVEELFEARKPKGVAILTDFGGKIVISEKGNERRITVHAGGELGEKDYVIPYGAKIKAGLKSGDKVQPGDPLTEGSLNPHDILRTRGIKGVQDYLVREVQAVYRMQGVEINDKHIEVIVRQMLRKVRVEQGGDSTALLPGDLVDILTFEAENLKTMQEGGEPPAGKPTLLGITKAALATDSFLSAASFQETARVLTEAAIKSKKDPLVGLKENVIIGKLIPAGTGMRNYQAIEPHVVSVGTDE